jgi:hypothetical protein
MLPLVETRPPPDKQIDRSVPGDGDWDLRRGLEQRGNNTSESGP